MKLASSMIYEVRMYSTLLTLTLFQGVTFRVVRGEMVIARILHGSSIDRQGMLHTGDIIREVNGREVGSDPHVLQELLRDCSGSITLKVLPSYKDTPAPPQVQKKEVSFSEFTWRWLIILVSFFSPHDQPWMSGWKWVDGCLINKLDARWIAFNDIFLSFRVFHIILSYIQSYKCTLIFAVGIWFDLQ